MGYQRSMVVFACAVILLIAVMFTGWGTLQAVLTVCALSGLARTLPLVGPSHPGLFQRCDRPDAGLLSGGMAAGIPLVLKWIA